VIFLNPVLAGIRQGLKNRQVDALFSAPLRGKTRIFDDYSYLCKGLYLSMEGCFVLILRYFTLNVIRKNMPLA